MINWDDAPKWATMIVNGRDGYYYLDHNRQGESGLATCLETRLHGKFETNHRWHVAEVIARRPEKVKHDEVKHDEVKHDEVKHDEVNNPAHYDLFPNEQVIDIIRKALTPEEFAGYCKGNVLKYRLRAGDKGDAGKCIAKANWYKNELWSK